MREKALSLLPFYVNGKISDADRAFVEQALQAHPVLQKELAFLQNVAEQVRESVEKVPESIGLGRVMARIEAEAEKPSKFSQIFSAFLSGGWMKTALTASVIGLCVQSWRAHELSSEVVQYRGASAQPGVVGTQANMAYVNVSFQPTASEAALRMLLAGAGAQIVAGPDLNGEYRLALPADQLEQSKHMLQKSGLLLAITPATDSAR
jgi:anti-sigma factor RsiW